MEYYAWSGFVAPAGTPPAVIDRINKSANVALTDQDVIKVLTANGFEIVGGGPEVFAKAMSSYISDVSEIGRKNNLAIARGGPPMAGDGASPPRPSWLGLSRPSTSDY